MKSKREAHSSLTVERSLLGACLLDPRHIDDLSHVERRHFWHDACGLVWQALVSMRANGLAIDAVTLGEELGRRGWLPIGAQTASDTTTFVLELMESVPHAYHAPYYARELITHAKRRAVLETAERIAEVGHDLSLDVDEAVLTAEQRLHEVMSIGQSRGPQALGELFCDALANIGRGEPRGIATGWTPLDDKFLGWCPGHLVILGARPSMGKTALALQLAQRVAETGRAALFISIEMTALEIAERLLARNAHVSEYTMRKGATSAAQNAEILHQSNMLASLKLVIDDASESLPAVLSAIRLARRRQHVDLVVIDYLQLIDNKSHSHVREQQISDISRSLKKAAKENSICVVALSQLNRGIEMREDKAPRLADLRESGSIEQDADCVMFLHRPGVYDSDYDQREAQIILAKQRAGATGKVCLDFDRQFGAFSAPLPAAFRMADAID